MDKIKKETEYEEYRQTLDDSEKRRLDEFFDLLSERTAAIEGCRYEIDRTYKQAILHYAEGDRGVFEILKTLDIDCLGGFYARKTGMWFPVDNMGDYKCHSEFGFVEICYSLGQKVIPCLLRIAVLYAVKRYPLFSCKLKRGFFRYFLDCKKGFPCVMEHSPEREVADGEFYGIFYKKNNMVIKYLDGIIDTYGALEFLRCISSKYYQLAEVNESDVRSHKIPPIYGENICGFDGIDVLPTPWVTKKKRCISISNDIISLNGGKGKRFTVQASTLAEHCRTLNATVLEYMIDNVIKGARASTDRSKGEISVGFSIDLRESYPTASMRNFTVDGTIRTPVNKTVSSQYIKDELSKQRSEEGIRNILGNLAYLYKETKYIPLGLKKYTKVFRDYKKLTDRSCYLSCFTGKVLEGEDFYITIKPHENEIGCFVTVLDTKAVVSVYNPGADPSFFETVREALNSDGMIVIEEIDRKTIEVNFKSEITR